MTGLRGQVAEQQLKWHESITHLWGAEWAWSFANGCAAEWEGWESPEAPGWLMWDQLHPAKRWLAGWAQPADWQSSVHIHSTEKQRNVPTTSLNFLWGNNLNSKEKLPKKKKIITVNWGTQHRNKRNKTYCHTDMEKKSQRHQYIISKLIHIFQFSWRNKESSHHCRRASWNTVLVLTLNWGITFTSVFNSSSRSITLHHLSYCSTVCQKYSQ